MGFVCGGSSARMKFSLSLSLSLFLSFSHTHTLMKGGVTRLGISVLRVKRQNEVSRERSHTFSKSSKKAGQVSIEHNLRNWQTGQTKEQLRQATRLHLGIRVWRFQREDEVLSLSPSLSLSLTHTHTLMKRGATHLGISVWRAQREDEVEREEALPRPS